MERCFSVVQRELYAIVAKHHSGCYTHGMSKKRRTGISFLEFTGLFPDEQAAREWFEATRWSDGRTCPKCGSGRTSEAKHKTMPYRCKDCHGYFSVKTGSVMESSKLPLLKWLWTYYLYATNLKGVSSMKLHRDIGVRQATAWFMLHRIREACANDDPLFDGVVEVDETYVGGSDRTRHAHKKQGLGAKSAVVGAKKRSTKRVKAGCVKDTTSQSLQAFLDSTTTNEAILATDGNPAYGRSRRRVSVNHSVGEYVRGLAHTNGIESFWAMLKRGYHGVYHQMSVKHLNRYVDEFTCRHNLRPLDTIDQMAALVSCSVGKRLKYADLMA